MGRPSIKAVAETLRYLKSRIGAEMRDETGNVGIEVRLQVTACGRWAIRDGDPQFDLDHRGSWGAGFLTRTTNCRELAKDLISEASDHAAQGGNDE